MLNTDQYTTVAKSCLRPTNAVIIPGAAAACGTFCKQKGPDVCTSVMVDPVDNSCILLNNLMPECNANGGMQLLANTSKDSTLMHFPQQEFDTGNGQQDAV